MNSGSLIILARQTDGTAPQPLYYKINKKFISLLFGQYFNPPPLPAMKTVSSQNTIKFFANSKTATSSNGSVKDKTDPPPPAAKIPEESTPVHAERHKVSKTHIINSVDDELKPPPFEADSARKQLAHSYCYFIICEIKDKCLTKLKFLESL